MRILKQCDQIKFQSLETMTICPRHKNAKVDTKVYQILNKQSKKLPKILLNNAQVAKYYQNLVTLFLKFNGQVDLPCAERTQRRCRIRHPRLENPADIRWTTPTPPRRFVSFSSSTSSLTSPDVTFLKLGIRSSSVQD